MTPRPALRVVDAETGEIQPDCPQCAEMADQVKGLERDIRAWRARNAELERDSERDARAHPAWAKAKEMFGYWRYKCRHPKCKFNAARFWLCEPFLREDGEELCRKAIDGAAYDPFTTRRRNGSSKRHDGWELIFRDRGKFEEFACRAPRAA